MILESRKAGSFSSFRMISTNGDYSQTVATVYAIRDNKNGVIPFMINPGKKNAFSLVISGGNVGLGITNPTSPLELANGAKCTVGGVWTNASSRQLKDNIEALSLDQALEVVRTLEPVTYTYKAEPDEPQVGFIAEDVPELVARNRAKNSRLWTLSVFSPRLFKTSKQDWMPRKTSSKNRTSCSSNNSKSRI